MKKALFLLLYAVVTGVTILLTCYWWQKHGEGSPLSLMPAFLLTFPSCLLLPHYHLPYPLLVKAFGAPRALTGELGLLLLGAALLNLLLLSLTLFLLPRFHRWWQGRSEGGS